MKTVITVTIDHANLLPDGITDAIADKAYGWAHNKANVRCEVTASLSTTVGTPSKDGKDSRVQEPCVAPSKGTLGLTAFCWDRSGA